MIDRTRQLLLAAVAVGAALIVAAPAAACSHDDTAYFDGFLDASCLQAPLTNTAIDTFGGLRLTTNGTATTTTWDTNPEFTTQGPVGTSTLAINGGSLTLPTTPLPLTPDGANPVLEPDGSTVLDSDNVDDPTVARVGSGYVMWYSGTAEDGTGPAIFRATSSNGKAWVRDPVSDPVLSGSAGTFDARGVFAPDVLYDAADPIAPYRMYYAGKGNVFGAIGYATSQDGITWTKHAGAVLDHGAAGSPDSFAASDPSVLMDGATWKLWYTGDDSSKKRIAYATSPDGITWTKGGKVISPEDPGANANYSFGAFAPSVYKTGDTYRMLLTGRKLVSGDTFQTKVMSASSSDGITWTAPSPSVNPSGTNTKFDFSNLNGPSVLSDPADSGTPYKLYYAGNTVDANGNFHTRIGYATSSNGTSFNKVQSGLGVNGDGSVLDIGALGSSFDARQASGLSVAVTLSGPKFAGVYSGLNGTDFTPRLGLATSADGSGWSKVAGGQTGGSLLPIGSGGQFDTGGQRDPDLIQDGTGYELYFTGLSSSGTQTIGHSSTATGPLAGWSDPSSAQAVTQSGFDADGVAHPSVLHDGATWVMWFTGYSGATPSIGRITSATTTFSGAASAITFTGADTYDHLGQKDPVVIADAGTYKMLYTGIAADGVERTLYATSANGTSWDRQGVALNPSQTAYAFDEVGIAPSGLLIDGTTLHAWTTGVDRTGRTRGGHATLDLSASPADGIPNGWATYQLGDASAAPRDWRSVTRTSSGAAVTLWMSFLQPYSSAGSEFWSDYFPVTVNDPSEALSFLLTVRGVRWQARLSGPSGAPSLDRVQIAHAPVSFSPSGQATTTDLAPPDGQAIQHWGDLTASTTMFAPNGSGSGGGTVTVLDAASGDQLASGALGTNGDTTLNLFSVDPAAHPKLRVRFDLTSDGAATPLVRSLKVLFNAAAQPPPPPVLTLAASVAQITFGQQATLAGNLSRSGAPLGSTTVSVAPVGGATTDAAGNYSLPVSPSATTTYTATSAGVTSPPSVTIAVAPAVTLKAKRKGKKAIFSGTLGPSQPGHPLEIQRLVAGAWKSFATTTATSASAISLSKKIKACGRYTFKAVVPADAAHVAGESLPVKVELHRLTLKVAVRGHKATFTGSVAPKHGGKSVLIQLAKGKRFVKFAKVRLTKRSTFKLVKKLKKGRYTFRASFGADRCHFGGISKTRALRVR